MEDGYWTLQIRVLWGLKTHTFRILQGEWKPKQIDNPNYKGPWVHPEIDNPEYEADPELYKRDEICAIGFDLWQVKAGTIFDNVLITDDVDYARKVGEEVWKPTFVRFFFSNLIFLNTVQFRTRSVFDWHFLILCIDILQEGEKKMKEAQEEEEKKEREKDAKESGEDKDDEDEDDDDEEEKENEVPEVEVSVYSKKILYL